MDDDLHSALLRLRERNVLLQVSTTVTCLLAAYPEVVNLFRELIRQLPPEIGLLTN